MRFVYETRKKCPCCRHEKDAVRVVDDQDKRFPGLRISRHFMIVPRGYTSDRTHAVFDSVLCPGSLDPAEKEQQ